MPSEEQVDKAIALIQKSGGNYEYFFEQLSNPNWIEPLARRDRFNHPPPLERVSNDAYRIPQWPEGQYLLRMASIASDAVVKAIGPACYESDNPLVHTVLIEIAVRVPAAGAREIAEKEIGWLKQQTSLFALYPEKAAALVNYLIEQNQIESALRFTDAILRVSAPTAQRQGTPVELDDGTTYTYRPSPDPVGKMDPFWSGRFRHSVIGALARRAPASLIASLAANVNNAVTIYNSNHPDNPEDHSTIWRQSIDHGSHHETLDETVSALTDAIKVLVEEVPGSDRMIVETMKRYTWPIFDRLSAFTLTISPRVDPLLLAEYVGDLSHFESRSRNPEFVELLSAKAAALPADVLEMIFNRIDAGPDPKLYEYHLTHRVRAEDVDTVRAAIIDQWRLDWLHPLAQVLVGKRQADLADLLTKFNPSGRPFRTGGARAVQEVSPTDLDTFETMTVPELVMYLKHWTPPTTGLPFDLPSRSGLGTTLSQWVSSNPQRASESIDAFLTTELDPIYINSILGAFTSSLQGTSQFDVYAVARAAKWVAESTDALLLPDGEGGFDRPTWNWAHMAAARFMGDLLLHEDRLDIARADELFDAVRPLAFLPHPTPEDEASYKKEPARYVSFALNTPRPVGVEAVIRFGRWLKLATPEENFSRNQLTRVFEVLESKLDPTREPSAAVREMFGMQFRILAWLELDWFNSVIPRLFPGKDGALPEEKTLDRFAWHAYLNYGGLVLATLPAMRKRYGSAIKSLQKAATKVENEDRTLASHLMQFYARGTIELDDPLLEQFFATASPAVRSQGIGDIGWSLGREDAGALSDEIRDRFMRLWESRMALLSEETRENAKELETFGWWADSGKFPEDWVIQQAMPILERQRCLRPDFATVKAFAALADRYPYQAVRVVHVLLEEDKDGWAIHGWNDHLDTILTAALRGGDDAKAEATAMIELLVSRGFRGYRRLLSAN